MSGVYEWIKTIVFYMILITVVLNILPSGKYHKYVRFFSGMILILLVMQPLTGLAGLEDKMAYYFGLFSFSGDAAELKADIEGMDEKRYQAMIAQYESAIAMDIEALVKEVGLTQIDAKVELNQEVGSEQFGRVSTLELTVAYEEDSGPPIYVEPVIIGGQSAGEGQQEPETAQVVQLKERLREFYGLEPEQIRIRLTGGG